MVARLPGLEKHGRPVDEGVAVHHPESHKLRVAETGNHTEDARLLAPLQLRLEPHETEMVASQRVLSELDNSVRLTLIAGVGQASSGRSAAYRVHDAP